MPKIVDPQARRQDVVDAVWRIIASDGLERASLREVADEAGLAVGSVRHYFAGSEELHRYAFAAVVDRVLQRLAAAESVVLAQQPGSAAHLEAVLTLLGEFLPLDEDRAMDACVWMAFKNAARIKPFLAGEADRSHRAVAAIVGQVISGLLPGAGLGDRLVIEAEHLLAVLDGLCMHALLQPEWMSAAMCHDVLQAHLAGMQARSSS
ncbi:TetR/AcrR family transcriptional regulator [Pseudarthrobacter sp. J64]|uniref:TetR/AcrR family transcriptional regulator n=1 Tax=Pseudarthrobacter sp. J64 TaxID=3116485 RepID=UPI002E81A5FD|nr:TetR/AcrR family transcriptional regulator [Pseudarthrobacter sp. J64]MEE2568208.1 TetR/AcrR family transcriptional regulator [Pseudarthrobacter sp. J64]